MDAPRIPFPGRARRRARRSTTVAVAGLSAVLCGVVASVGPVTAAPVELKAEFPRLGSMQNGRTHYRKKYADPAYQRAIARLDYVVLGGSSRQMTQHARAIKRLNPNIIIGKYTNITAIRDKDGPYTGPVRKKLFSERGPNDTNAHDWWLRDGAGERVTALSRGNMRVNITDWAQPDADGLYWVEWKARFDHDFWMKDPVWDVWYSDIGHWRPRLGKGVDGDFSGGRTADRGQINRAWRLGHRRHWNAIRALRPDILISVNHDWYQVQHRQGEDFDLGVFAEQVNGGQLEEVFKHKEGGFEYNRGWARLYEAYRWSYGYMVEPVVLMLTASGPTDNYQYFRYAFGTTLLGDAFFGYLQDGPYRKGSVEWYDEYDLAGRSDTSWMGRPEPGSAFPEQPWRQGIFRRDFEHATVLVNPRGNGEQTVEIEPGFRHIDGRQDPEVNHGGPAGRIVLKDADAILLVRDRGPGQAP